MYSDKNAKKIKLNFGLRMAQITAFVVLASPLWGDNPPPCLTTREQPLSIEVATFEWTPLTTKSS